MARHYSPNDILGFYNNSTSLLESTLTHFSEENEHNDIIKQHLDVIGGLAFTNSIHEMFIKAILKNHKTIHNISSNNYSKLVRKFKSPIDLKNLIVAMGLDLQEAFNLEIERIQSLYPEIISVDNIINIINSQREDRNHFLHGDLKIDEIVSKEVYSEKVLLFQRLHHLVLRMLRYSYLNIATDINSLANNLTNHNDTIHNRVKNLTEEQKQQIKIYIDTNILN